MIMLQHHRLWPELLPLLRAQRYDRDGGHNHPRYRLEVMEPGSARLRAALLAIEVDCAANCGRLVHPVRERRTANMKYGRLFIAVACELSRSYSCSRSRAASYEYNRIIEQIHEYEESRQQRLML